VKQIFNRLFRLYAIIYNTYYMDVESVGAVPHLNTSFKHFMYFVFEFDLVKEQEFGALTEIVERHRTNYRAI
jgi:MOB kinase activator 1